MRLETDWERLERMNDDEIDYTDIPPLTNEFFQRAKLYVPPQRAVVLDADVFEWVEQQGQNPQVTVNTMIRNQMKRQARQGKKLSRVALS